MNKDTSDKIKELEEEIRELRGKIDTLSTTLKEHTHTGKDGSPELNSGIDITAKSFTAQGISPSRDDIVSIPIVVKGNTAQSKKENTIPLTGIGMTTLSGGSAVEGVFLVSNKNKVSKQSPATNRTDFNDIQEGELLFQYIPDSNIAFFMGGLTPYIYSIDMGTISKGGNTLTDQSAHFVSNQLSGSYVTIRDSSENVLETHQILSNDANTITIDGNWDTESGSYTYEVFTPVYNGSATAPWKRIYAGEDIRLGYGSSSGSQVAFIKIGDGSPEGVVFAPPGSLYLNREGGANTSLYVKESGNGNTGWVAK